MTKKELVTKNRFLEKEVENLKLARDQEEARYRQLEYQLKQRTDLLICDMEEAYKKKLKEKKNIKRLLKQVVDRIEINCNTNGEILDYVKSYETLYKIYKEE